MSYQPLVWQCRFSGIEVPEPLWSCATIGDGAPYPDDQAENLPKEHEALTRFDYWFAAFTALVETKGPMPEIKQAECASRTTTNTDKQAV